MIHSSIAPKPRNLRCSILGLFWWSILSASCIRQALAQDNNNNTSAGTEDAEQPLLDDIIDNSTNFYNVAGDSQSCIPEATDACFAKNQFCFQDLCAACLEGFIEWPDVITFTNDTTSTTTTITDNTQGDSNANGGETDYQVSPTATITVSNTSSCINVTELRVELFQTVFQPVWLKSEQEAAGNLTEAKEIMDKRLNQLQQAAQFISTHNAQQPPPAFTLGLNEFSADTEAEAQALRGYQLPDGENATDGSGESILLKYLSARDHDAIASSSSQEALPSKMDWVKRGAVTSVKDQGTYAV